VSVEERGSDYRLHGVRQRVRKSGILGVVGFFVFGGGGGGGEGVGGGLGVFLLFITTCGAPNENISTGARNRINKDEQKNKSSAPFAAGKVGKKN